MKPIRFLPFALLIASAQAFGQVETLAAAPDIKDRCLKADTPANCYVGIVVTQTVVEGRTGCTVELSNPADHEVIAVKRYQPVIVLWKIESPPKGYTFALDGIEFTNNAAPRQFVGASRTSDKLSYWWTNKNNRGRIGFYEYEINVINDLGTVVCSLPNRWIKNQ